MTQDKNMCANAFVDDVLGTMDATALASKIKAGELSANEVCEATIKRIKQVNPDLNAIAHEQYHQAIQQADIHNNGFFAGIPFLIKDNLRVKNLPMQHGSQAISGHLRSSNDPFVQQMLAMGFNLLGKSNMPELGLNCATEYADGTYVANPWHLGHISGGSSGGAAALVASGAVPIAHGNDGAGSLRIPAAMCGLFALKCSRGRHIQTDLSRPLPLNIITEGVLTRTVRDCANFFMQLEAQYKPAKLPLLGEVSSPIKARLKIGVLKTSINDYPVDAETKRVLEETVTLLKELGHEVVEAQPLSQIEDADAFLVYFAFLAFSAGMLGRSIYGKGFQKNKLNSYSKALSKHFIRNSYKIPCMFRQGRKAGRYFFQQMQKYDVVLSPVLTQSAPKAGHLSPNVEFAEILSRLTNLASFNAVHNIMGTPSMSVPLGLSGAHSETPNLPIGMQFAANIGEDKKLLQLAFELEQAAGFTHLYSK